jgi:putative transposase
MELPKRKKIRLEGYDYSSCGAYFVTICITDRNTLLWNVGADIIRPNEPPLSKYGEFLKIAIDAIPEHYANVVIDKYCIMPDHVHMIVFILPDENGRMISAPTLSVIIGSMKRWVSKQIGFSIWQKSFNDRIIRNEQGYREAWQYIDENILNLDVDKGAKMVY